jgi:LEA14-like dessication related protein
MRKLFVLLLVILVFASCKSKPEFLPEPEQEAITVIKPDFEIVSIAVIQADLINTQFEAILKINNPNDFEVNLSALTYRLYGNGRFWADGKGFDILNVPAKSSSEAEFYFTMNFIDMRRDLLDDIIAMRQVNYRFDGDVEVEPVIQRAVPFKMHFERTGFSSVRQRVGRDRQTRNGNGNTAPAIYVDSW